MTNFEKCHSERSEAQSRNPDRIGIPPLSRHGGIGRDDNKTFQNRGFTLVEVLVAATIVGLLSTIGMTGFQAVTRSGRDALRKTDLEQIRSALEIYKSENSVYPSSSSCAPVGLTSGYINPYPSDPKPAAYRYCYIAGAGSITYQLCAHLENGSSTSDTGCGGGNQCTGNCNYQVINP